MGKKITMAMWNGMWNDYLDVIRGGLFEETLGPRFQR